MSSLARSCRHGRRQWLSHVLQSKTPVIIAKKRFRSITCAIHRTHHEHRPQSFATSVRYLSTSDADNKSKSESIDVESTIHATLEDSSYLHLGAADLDVASDDDDDRLPFENDSDDDESEDEDDADNAEILAEGMFDITKTSALGELNNYYSNEYGYSGVTKFIRTQLVDRQWFATFVCPETGIEYAQGTLRREFRVVFEKSSIDGSPPGYLRKNTAIHAAAARVLDIIQYQKLQIKEPRLCQEDPALFGKQSLDDEFDDNNETAVASEGVVVSASPHEVPAGMQETDQMGLTWQTEDITDDDDYTLEYIPTPSADYDPSHRLLQAFSTDQEAHRAVTTPAATLDSHRMPIMIGPVQRLKIAVDVAKSWAQANTGVMEEMKGNPHRMQLPRSASAKTLLIGKTLLEGLAEANQSVAVSSGFVGCEQAAWKILDVLWEHGDSTPDTDSYNHLLKCLEGSNPKRIASKAEAIVAAMDTGMPWRDRVLPKPNMGTRNTLIQLWAQVGGTTGRYQDLGPDFVPNRESFLSVLSSCCYIAQERKEDGGLDIEFAADCIRRMRELYEANPDDLSLVPDIQVYNAPLRWTGASVARQTRPYARPLPWDMFYHLYGDVGPRQFDASEKNVAAAQSYEKWIDMMREQGVEPNVETYEALMQAWLRTSTRVGLDRAQSLAETLLSEGLHRPDLQLQSFRPLVVSWMFSREADAGEKIQALITSLEFVSAQRPELKPDTRFFMGWVTACKNLVKKQTAAGKTVPTADLIDMAEQGTSILKRLHTQLTSDLSSNEAPDIFFETVFFIHTLELWEQVAAAYIVPNSTFDSERFKHALNEMALVMDIHDELIQSILRVESSDGIGLRLRREFSFQLKHLLAKSGALYSSFVWGLRVLDDSLKKLDCANPLTSLLVEHLPLFERIVRRSGEMEIASKHDIAMTQERFGILDADEVGDISDPRVHSALSDTVEYSDFFTGFSLRKRNLEATSREALLHQMLKCLQNVDLEDVNNGDFARLLLLIKAASTQVSSTPSNGFVDTLLLRLIRSHQDHTPGDERQEMYNVEATRGGRKVRSRRSKVTAKSLTPSPRSMPKKREQKMTS